MPETERVPPRIVNCEHFEAEMAGWLDASDASHPPSMLSIQGLGQLVAKIAGVFWEFVSEPQNTCNVQPAAECFHGRCLVGGRKKQQFEDRRRDAHTHSLCCVLQYRMSL